MTATASTTVATVTLPRVYENRTANTVYVLVIHAGEDTFIDQCDYETRFEATQAQQTARDVGCDAVIVKVPPGTRLDLERLTRRHAAHSGAKEIVDCGLEAR